MPFRLRWPTEFPHIIQPFGVNRTGIADFYTRFGLPAHEGLDFMAPTGSRIFACADGEVIRATANRNEAYGIQVRIRHLTDEGEFETVYAHLQELRCKRGDRVAAGDVIGLANNTGNSRGSHLHLTLKKKGQGTFVTVVNGKRLAYPRDIIDPTPYLDPFVPPPDRTETLPPAKKEEAAESAAARRAAPAPGTYNLDYVADVTVPDETVFAPGVGFVKIWRVRNNGTRAWDAGCTLAFSSDTLMSVERAVPLPALEPGQIGEISVPMTAPPVKRRYKSSWQARAGDGTAFGDIIYLIINVR
jgi:hypothetical protein